MQNKTDVREKESEEEIVDVVVLEESVHDGKRRPLARKYRFKVNETLCTWDKPTIFGRQILEQAQLLPSENYSLREKIHAEPPKLIKLDDTVDLRAPGVEKFRAIRRDQTEGERYG